MVNCIMFSNDKNYPSTTFWRQEQIVPYYLSEQFFLSISLDAVLSNTRPILSVTVTRQLPEAVLRLNRLENLEWITVKNL